MKLSPIEVKFNNVSLEWMTFICIVRIINMRLHDGVPCIPENEGVEDMIGTGLSLPFSLSLYFFYLFIFYYRAFEWAGCYLSSNLEPLEMKGH